jgi:hypothetical protein
MCREIAGAWVRPARPAQHGDKLPARARSPDKNRPIRPSRKRRKLSNRALTQGTYWHHRDRTKPYHIDYIFVPTAWLKNMVSFDIGSFENWCVPGLSDHAPLTAEFT